MADILAKGKACLPCRTRKSVRGFCYHLTVLTLCAFQKCDGADHRAAGAPRISVLAISERPKKVDVLETQIVSLTNRLRILEMRRVKPSSPTLCIDVDDIPARWWEADELPRS